MSEKRMHKSTFKQCQKESPCLFAAVLIISDEDTHGPTPKQEAQEKIQTVRDHMNVSTDKAKITCLIANKILSFILDSLIEAKTLSR